MNTQESKESDPIASALFGLSVISLIILYMWLLKRRKREWQYWEELVGVLQPKKRPIGSEKRDMNIKKKRDRKKNESKQRRIGQC